MGRKTKLTPELQEQICKYISIGVPNKVAAQACGIDERTFYRWIEKGNAQERGIYRQFCQAVKKAESESIARDVAIIGKAAHEGKWQASAWKLERRHPELFGVKTETKLKHSGKIDIGLFKKYLEEEEING